MTDTERIEKLEKENKIMKKIIIMLISNVELKNFDSESKEVLETLLGHLIL